MIVGPAAIATYWWLSNTYVIGDAFQCVLASKCQSTVPFVRAGAGLSYFDYDITRDDLTKAKGHKFGAVTSLEAGFQSSNRFRASVRYYLFPTQSGVDFSGFLISASFGVFKL